MLVHGAAEAVDHHATQEYQAGSEVRAFGSMLRWEDCVALHHKLMVGNSDSRFKVSGLGGFSRSMMHGLLAFRPQKLPEQLYSPWVSNLEA